MPDDTVWFPDILDRHEARIDRDIAQDARVAAKAKPAPDMTAQFSDDIGFVYRQVRIAEERNISIEAAMDAAQQAGDDDAHDAAREAFDAAYGELVTLEWRMLELEGREGRAEERELRSDYYRSVL